LPSYQLGSFSLLQRADGLLKRQSASHRQVHRALRTLKKAHIEFTFQRLNMLRQRRLRNAEALGRPAEMQFVREYHQAPELTQIHVFSNFCRLTLNYATPRLN
jgi:hypothetical protein